MDNQKDNNIKDLSLTTNPIRWARYVSLKGQKLTQAIYLITSSFSDSEPLKWRLRDTALDVLSDISVLQPTENLSVSPLFKVTVLESATTKIDQLISWLEVALSGNFSSDMNLALLLREYTDFNSLLKERVKTTGLNKLIHLSNEDLPKLEAQKNPEPINRDLSHKREDNSIGHKEQNNDSYQKLSRLPHKSRDVAKDSRRSLIINFLKGKDWTSIKDITSAISGCSAKTIQRELADLVHQGLLKKKGDRRWSRYLLS